MALTRAPCALAPPLCADLEWKLIYVGSADSSAHDQELDSLLVGPIPLGRSRFVLQADAPDVTKIPDDQVVSVTVALLTCSYRNQEFIRIGYYVNNEYELADGETMPSVLDPARITRNILSDKPRVTRFPISWDAVDETAMTVSDQTQAQAMEGMKEEAAVGEDDEEEDDDDDLADMED